MTFAICPSRFADAQRAKGMPVLTWTVRTLADRARAAEHASQIIYEVRRDDGEPVDRRHGGRHRRVHARGSGCAAPARTIRSWPCLPERARGFGQRGRGTGWRPLPIAIDGAGRRARRVLPAYVKSHSQGEYVFDHGWADAWQRAGGALLSQAADRRAVHAGAGPAAAARATRRSPPALIARGRAVVPTQNDLSSAHATFIEPEQRAPCSKRAGWLIRADMPVPLGEPRLRELRRFPRRACPRASARRSARSGRGAQDGARDPPPDRRRDRARRIGTPSGTSTRTPARANGASPT